MGRPTRIDPPGALHHVVNRGVDRQAIFRTDADRVEFGRLLGEAHDRCGVWVHAYCLMDNHYHLLLGCPEGGLSVAMQLIGSVYVRHFNARAGREGPLFTGRFFARQICDDRQLVAATRYIHRNPLAFLPVDRLPTYRWSSLRTYLGHRQSPRWLRTDVVGSAERAIDAHLVDGHLAPALEIGHLVDLATYQHADEITYQGADRTVLALLLDQLDGGDERAVRVLLDFPNGGAERAARSRARRRAREQPALGRIVDDVLGRVA